LELVDALVKDIQHLKAETIRARYELSLKYDPEHKWITAVDILSELTMPHYDSMAYQQYVSLYYDGGDPMSFKGYIDQYQSVIDHYNDYMVVAEQLENALNEYNKLPHTFRNNLETSYMHIY
jgi:hypothetical protein